MDGHGRRTPDQEAYIFALQDAQASPSASYDGLAFDRQGSAQGKSSSRFEGQSSWGILLEARVGPKMRTVYQKSWIGSNGQAQTCRQTGGKRWTVPSIAPATMLRDT